MTVLPGLDIQLPDGWDTGTLAEVTSKIGSGATPRGGASVYVQSGPALIRSQNIYDHEFRSGGLVFLSSEAANALRGVTVEPGDVLINITGDSILRTALVPDYVLPARVNQHVAIVRSNDRVVPAFLQKWLSLDLMKDFMLGHSSGGTRKAITKGHLLSFPVPIPPLPEQRAIAAVLGALDIKIESNRTILAKSLNLARALFESALSSDSRSAVVGEVAEFHNRRRIPLSSQEREARVGTIPYYGATGVFGYVDEALFDEVLVLVGEDGSVVREDGGPVLQYIWGPAWINNHAHPLTGKGISTEVLCLALDRADVRPIVTGAVQPKVSMSNLKSVQLDLPSGASLIELECELVPLFALYRHRAEEAAKLTKLRAALFPELLLGRIRVTTEKVAT